LKRINFRLSDDIRVRKIEEVDIVPTLRCNLNCVMCHQAEIKCSEEMSLEEFKTIISRLKNAGVTKISLVGGEILILKDLWKFIGFLEDVGMRYDLATNAVALSDEDIKRIVKLKFMEKVTTSLDGDRETHNKIRRSTIAYDRTVESIRKLLGEGIRINVGCVVQKANFEMIENIFDSLCEMGVDDISFLFELRISKEERERSGKIVESITGKNAYIFMSSTDNVLGDLGEKDLKAIRKKFKRLAEKAKVRGISLGLPIQLSDPNVLSDKTNLKNYSCAIFKGYNFQLYNDGVLPFCPFISLGKEFNLFDKSPKGIINSKEYVLLRKAFKERGALPICRKCCALCEKN